MGGASQPEGVGESRARADPDGACNALKESQNVNEKWSQNVDGARKSRKWLIAWSGFSRRGLQ